jgi:hypothetical protein
MKLPAVTLGSRNESKKVREMGGRKNGESWRNLYSY